MIVHRCDVCGAESTEAATLTHLFLRVNLEGVAASQPSYVQAELDVCASKACRKKGIEQLLAKGQEDALIRAGLLIVSAKAV